MNERTCRGASGENMQTAHGVALQKRAGGKQLAAGATQQRALFVPLSEC